MVKTYRTELEIIGVNKNDAYYSDKKNIIGLNFFEDFGAEIGVGETFNMAPSNSIDGKRFFSIKVEVKSVNYIDAKPYGDKDNEEWRTGVEQRLDDLESKTDSLESDLSERLDDLESKTDSLESDLSDKADQSDFEDVKGNLEDLKTRHNL